MKKLKRILWNKFKIKVKKFKLGLFLHTYYVLYIYTPIGNKMLYTNKLYTKADIISFISNNGE